MPLSRNRSNTVFVFIQLLDEKKELKSALFRFAETFGHPDTDEVKNLTRDVHDRYLFVKRLIRKNSANVSLEKK